MGVVFSAAVVRMRVGGIMCAVTLMRREGVRAGAWPRGAHARGASGGGGGGHGGGASPRPGGRGRACARRGRAGGLSRRRPKMAAAMLGPGGCGTQAAARPRGGGRRKD